MPTLTKKVFLSSTLIDLKEYRAAAAHACQRAGFLPIYMEDFPPDPRSAVAFCISKVDEADLFLGVYAHRYGYVPDGADISITEMEYDRAIERGLPVHLFVIDGDYPWPPSTIDKETDYRRLKRFKDKIGKPHVWKTFGDLAKFKEDVLHLFHELAFKEAQAPTPPPERGKTSKRTLPSPPEMYSVPPYILTNRFIGRRNELDELDAWARSENPMLVIEAIGGMGKSALTWEWARERARQSIPTLAGILWWSFYEGGASTASFVREALAYLNGDDPEALRSKPKGDLERRLLAELRRQPFLLVLDGFERLLTAYHHHDPSKLQDDQIKSDLRGCTNSQTEDLLRQLVVCSPSRVLVTTRLMPLALENRANQPLKGVRHLGLHGLAQDDGERLLRDLGVRGNSVAIRHFLRQFDNHTLLIGVLAGRILDYRPAPGNFDRWLADRQAGGRLRLSELDLKQRRTHILAYALEGLNPQIRQLLSQIAVLSDTADYATVAALNPFLPPRPPRVYNPLDLGWEGCHRLYMGRTSWIDDYQRDREAYKDYRRALQEYPRSREYKEAVVALDYALRDLEERRLLQWDRESNTYDVHPVVRGYASCQLEDHERVQAYGVIHDHFERLPLDNVADATELSELKNAIQIYRALVGAGKLEEGARFFISFLSSPILLSVGACSTGVELLAPLFRDGFELPPAVADAGIQMSLLGNMAFALVTVGRPEAPGVVRAWVGLGVKRDSWRNVAAGLYSYSIYLMSLNLLASAFLSIKLSHSLSSALGDVDAMTRSFYDDLWVNVCCGQLEKAEVAYREFSARPIPRLESYRVGDAEAWFCLLKFYKGTLQQKDLEKFLGVAIKAKNFYAQKRFYEIWAEIALQENDTVAAFQAAERVLEIARKREERSPKALGCMARALVLQGRKQDALSLIETTAVPPIDAAEVYFAVGDREKSEELALRAYHLAWADGPRT